jgi:hypothetical protein
LEPLPLPKPHQVDVVKDHAFDDLPVPDDEHDYVLD